MHGKSNLYSWIKASFGAFFFLTSVVLILLFVAGCTTTPAYSAAPYADELWKAQSVQDLAFDYRCDQKFDFSADCAPQPTRVRLRQLRNAPPDILAPLQAIALKINQNWDGK